MIQIDLRDLKDGETLEVHEKIDGKKEDLEFWDLTYPQPLSYDGTVERVPNTLLVRGRIRAKAEWICSRCLEKCEWPVDEDVDFAIQFKQTDEWIDILESLREIVVLNHPMRFLCKPDCQGICPSCGINLNTGSCGCDRSDIPMPFEQLGNFFKKKDKKKGS